MSIIDTMEFVARALPIDQLEPGLDVRLNDDTEQLGQLAASIRELGVLQPLVVCPQGETFEVIAGRRRLAAARQAGLTTVPCIVRELDRSSRLDVAMAENMHRRMLSPIELALGYAEMQRRGANQTEIGRRIGRTGAHVSQVLSLLKFPTEVQHAIHHGRLAYTNVVRNPAKFANGMPVNQKGGHTRARVKPLMGNETALVSHWRLRHDRIVAQLYAIQRARPNSVDEVLRLIDKVIKLDAQPLTTEPSAS